MKVLLIKSFNPKELVEVSGIDLITPRLVIFQDKGFCRYYLGIRRPRNLVTGPIFRSRLWNCLRKIWVSK
jgi:hypothetical protein